MRLNILATFLVTIAAALGGIYWKVDHDFFAEKLAWNESQSRSEIAAISKSVEAELEGLTQVLDLSMPTLLDMHRDYNSDQVFSRFQMIAKLNPAPSGSLADAKLDPVFFLDRSSVKSWGLNYAQVAMKSLRPNDVEGTTVLSLLDPQRKPWFLLIANSKVTQSMYAAILPSDFLQGIIDRQKGQSATIALMNSQSQVFAHSTAEYIGNVMTDDPMAQQIASSGNVSGSGVFNGMQGEKVHGFYERVSNSNLYVTMATPIRVLMGDRAKIKMRFIYLGLGLACLGTLLILLLDKPATTTSVKVVDRTTMPLPPAPIPQPAAKTEPVTNTAIILEKIPAPVPPPMTSPLAPQLAKGPPSLNAKKSTVKENPKAPSLSIATAPTSAPSLPPLVPTGSAAPPLPNLTKTNPGIAKTELPEIPPSSEAATTLHKLTPENEERTEVSQVTHIQRFDALFSDRKIGEAFAMIDELESPPPVPTPAETDSDIHSEKTVVAMNVLAGVKAEAAPPMPKDMQVAEPKIVFEPKVRKADSVAVHIRKPKTGNLNPEGNA